MKSLKMLMMVALTILSVSLFAQVSTKYRVKASEQNSGMCLQTGTALNLSIKEKNENGGDENICVPRAL